MRRGLVGDDIRVNAPPHEFREDVRGVAEQSDGTGLAGRGVALDAGERIIEIATLITDANLEIVAEGPELVVHQPDELLAAMDEWNREHHGASGLTERVRASTTTEAEAERQTLEFVKAHCGPRQAPLAGNSRNLTLAVAIVLAVLGVVVFALTQNRRERRQSSTPLAVGRYREQQRWTR